METMPRKPYVSCIKLNGKPILPPLITSEIRKELNIYKHQAIKLETRLKNCRELKRNLDELLKLQPLSERPISQLTFGDNSHVEALGIGSTLHCISDKPTVNPKHHVSKKNLNLKKDVVEITEYTGNSVKVILDYQATGKTDSNDVCDNSGSNECSLNDPLDTEFNDLEETHNSSQEIEKESSIEISIEDSIQCKERAKPRLIRSNSYTLEAPSPILLAHLHKNTVNDLPLARAWCSVEDNSTPSSSEEFNSINTVFNQNIGSPKHTNGIQNTSKINSTSSNNTELHPNFKENKSPTIEVYQTDISVQQITVNTNKNDENHKQLDQKTTFFLKDPVEIFESDSELMKVLKDIPDNYADQIIELLKKQHLEKQERLERYTSVSLSPQQNNVKEHSIENTNNLNSSKDNESCEINNTGSAENYNGKNLNHESPESHIVFDNNKCNKNLINIEDDSPTRLEYDLQNPAIEPLCIKQDNRMRRSSTFSVSPSQSIYYSLSDTSNTITPLNTPTIKLIDLEYDSYEENRKHDASMNILSKFETGQEKILARSGQLNNKENYKFCESLRLQCSPNISVSRELFPVSKIDEKTMNLIRKDWAASVICAYAKGFLTRRLLKTERVQGIIETIKDALVCAVELHKAENIDEKDVELHRRLIQQVSAACYAFHEIFFDLSTSEKMQIIALDRQRKLDKAKRSHSAARSDRSNRSNRSMRSASSSRLSSSPRSKINTQRQSQSLTKV